MGLKQNSIACLPTGSGKTLVGAGIVSAMLHINPTKVAVFIVNTNHLVEQQTKALEDEIDSAKIVTMYGQMDPELRRNNLKVLQNAIFKINGSRLGAWKIRL